MWVEFGNLGAMLCRIVLCRPEELVREAPHIKFAIELSGSTGGLLVVRARGVGHTGYLDRASVNGPASCLKKSKGELTHVRTGVMAAPLYGDEWQS